MNEKRGRGAHWDDDDRAEVGRAARATPLGVPVLSRSPEDSTSRRHRRQPDTGELAAEAHEATTDLTPRVTALESGRRAVQKWLATAVIGAIGSVGAVLVWALNAREASGLEKARLQYLEREVERLRTYVYRSPALWRDEPEPWPAAIPARKEPTP